MKKTASILISGSAIALVALALWAYFNKKKPAVSSTVGGAPVPASASNPKSGTVIGPALTENSNVAPCPIGTHIDADFSTGNIQMVCTVD